MNQSDMTWWRGMVQGSIEYSNIHGHSPLWVTSMFSGMPGYTVGFPGPWTPVEFFGKLMTLGLPKPMNFFFLASICFYIMCMCLRIKNVVAIIGSLAFAYASFTPIIIGAGHDTQILALAYCPALLGSIILIYDKKYVLGFSLTAFFAMQELGMNHQQITYYLFLVAGCATVAYLVTWIREKQYAHAAKAISLTAVAVIIGILVTAVNLFTTYDLTKYSKRGGQLVMDDKAKSTAGSDNKTKGLSIEYAFQWSYGKEETFTLLYPGIMGYGARGATLDGSSHVAKYLEEKKNQSAEQAEQIAQGLSGAAYWGEQPFTEGPVYLGAIVCFLFVFGLFYLKGIHPWWITIAAFLAILMSWGKNLEFFNSFLFNYLPFYNKFRVPTMTLVIPQLLFPIMGALTLDKLLGSKPGDAELWKSFKRTLVTTGALLVISGIMYVSLDYKSENITRTQKFNELVASKSTDMNAQYQALNNQYEARTDNKMYENLVFQTNGDTETARGILSALRQDRQSLFGKDIFRSFVFILLAAGLLWAYIKNKIKAPVLLAGIGLLIFVDLYVIDKRYLTEENFTEATDYEAQAFPLSEADKQILQDKDPNYRVYNMASGMDPFSESRTSYYHKSIGGNNAAKLGIYDDLISYQLSGSPNPQVLNMLNTRYIIQRDQQNKEVVYKNPDALGNCWFVKGVRFVKGPKEEMKALYSFPAKDTAIVEEAFKGLLPASIQFDSTATIKQTAFDNDTMHYESNSPTPQVAIFSEIYYKGGWNAYIDSKPAEYFKANYVLRGLTIPAGKHSIVFIFEPQSWKVGYQLSKYTSFLVLLLLAWAVSDMVRRRKATVVS